MKTNHGLQRDVLDALRWEPSIDAAEIGVTVEDHVVILSGHVRNLAEKWEAEQVTKRVAGVQAVANDLAIDLGVNTHDDTEIAEAAVHALTWNVIVPQQRIIVTVSHGWLKLEGAVDWQYQKTAAEQTVRFLEGVKGVTDLIVVKPSVSSAPEIKAQIEHAFARDATLDAQQVTVETQGHKVILRGKVRTWAELEEAEHAAWSAPGVTEIENHLVVSV